MLVTTIIWSFSHSGVFRWLHRSLSLVPDMRVLRLDASYLVFNSIQALATR